MCRNQTLNRAKELGLKSFDHQSIEVRVVRAIQQRLGHPLCFATDQRYDCDKQCEWREQCVGLIAAWQR